jgi:branched-chain amino acid transport system ATP-binding protein
MAITIENHAMAVPVNSQVGVRVKARTPILQAVDVSVNYGRVRALTDAALTLHRGETALVLGLNGAGKTTLLRALAGITPVRGGRVRYFDCDVTNVAAHRRARAGIALLPEGRGVLPGLSVRDNVLLGVRTAARGRRWSATEALEWLASFFPPLANKLDQDCSTLSGGEMQMLGLARALASRPNVLLVDEPSLGLAPKATAIVYEALGRLAASGMTTIIVEQKAVPLAAVPDAVLVLRNGHVVHEMRGEQPTQEELRDIYLGGGA